MELIFVQPFVAELNDQFCAFAPLELGGQRQQEADDLFFFDQFEVNENQDEDQNPADDGRGKGPDERQLDDFQDNFDQTVPQVTGSLAHLELLFWRNLA